MTPCDYLKAIDYLLYDLEDQLDTNYLSAKSPNKYGYQLFLWNLQEINAVLGIAETLNLREWVEKHHCCLMRDIEGYEEEFCEEFLIRKSRDEYPSFSLPIEDMFSECDDIFDELLKQWTDNIWECNDFYEGYAKTYMALKLMSLLWDDVDSRVVVRKRDMDD